MEGTEQIADLIWSTLNTKENESLSKDDQIKLIQPIISEALNLSRKSGKTSVLNYIQEEINCLRKNS